jgi:uncharacterized iron-regulated membrane protein
VRRSRGNDGRTRSSPWRGVTAALGRAERRAWSVAHKWTSLVCTLFLLVICLTGLPLTFHEEIGDWLSDDPPYAALPADALRANRDTLVDAALARYRGEIVRSMFVDDDEPKVVVTLAPSMDAEPQENHWLKFDARTGDLLKDGIATRDQLTFLRLMLRLHVDVFAGLSGGLFLRSMGLLFVVALVSGVVLYAPFMSKLDFGALRWRRNSRILWLDMHNLLGVATLAWALAVGPPGSSTSGPGLFSIDRRAKPISVCGTMA